MSFYMAKFVLKFINALGNEPGEKIIKAENQQLPKWAVVVQKMKKEKSIS